MKKIITIILFLMPLFLMAQTAPPIVQGSKLYEFRNGLRIDSAFFIPRKDTLFFDNTLKAPGMITWRPADSTFYLYRGNRWLSIVSSAGTGLSIDSVRRSNDTLFFRYTTGGELAVKIAGLPISAVTNLSDSLAAQTLQTVTNKGNTTTNSIGIGTTPVAKLHVLSTTEQLRLSYDASNYLSFSSTNPTGSFAITAVGSNSNRTITISPATLFPAGITTGTEATNIYIGSVTAPFLTSNYRYLFGGATSVQGSVAMVNGGVNLLSTNNNYYNVIIGGNDVTTPPTGINDKIASLVVKQPNVISGGATVNNVIGGYFNNTASGGYSIFSDTGLVKINDTLIVRRIRATGNVKFTKGSPGIGKAWIDSTGQGDGAWQTITSGTVTSVGLSAPSIFSVGGSPVTSSGTLALSFATGQTANQVLASPDGTTGAVSLRSLVAADIPNHDAAKITTGVFPSARLGTGSAGAGAKFLRDDGTFSNALAGPFFVTTGAVTIQAGSLTATSTGGSQFGGGYDGSNKWVASTGSSGITSFTFSGTSPLAVFNQLTAFQGGISTNSGSANASNFGAAGAGAGTTGIGTAGLLWGGSATVSTKAWFNGTTSTVAGVNDNISNIIAGKGAWTTAGSGFHAYGGNIEISSPTITIGTAQVGFGGNLILYDSSNYAQHNSSLTIAGKGAFRTNGRIILGLTGVGDPNDSVMVKGGADSVLRAIKLSDYAISNQSTIRQTASFNISGDMVGYGVRTFSGTDSLSHWTLYQSFVSAAKARWSIGLQGDSANFSLRRINSLGITVDTPFLINRTTGNIGLGITTPTNRVHINGSFRIQDGFPGIGKFWKDTTGTGVGAWNTISGGDISFPIQTVTGNTTLTAANFTTLVNNTGTVTITLPAASSSLNKIYVIKKISAALNNVVIDPNGAELIDGSATQLLTLQNSSVIIQCDGAAWYIVSAIAGGTSL